MVTAIDSQQEQAEVPSRKKHSALRFPVYDLADSVVVAKRIHESGGGSASDDALATYLDYKSTNNGAYLSRVAATKLFGLIEGGRAVPYTLTERAKHILMPVYSQQAERELVEAFLAVPLFNAVYDGIEQQGREIPPDFGMKNMLRNQLGVTPSRVDVAYRTLMNSAETAGFFATRGAKTHLIMPIFQQRERPEDKGETGDASDTPVPGDGDGDGDGGGDGKPPERPASSLGQLRAEYVSTLIAMLREQSASGDVDVELMARIEKLLGIEEGGRSRLKKASGGATAWLRGTGSAAADQPPGSSVARTPPC